MRFSAVDPHCFIRGEGGCAEGGCAPWYLDIFREALTSTLLPPPPPTLYALQRSTPPLQPSNFQRGLNLYPSTPLPPTLYPLPLFFPKQTKLIDSWKIVQPVLSHWEMGARREGVRCVWWPSCTYRYSHIMKAMHDARIFLVSAEGWGKIEIAHESCELECYNI